MPRKTKAPRGGLATARSEYIRGMTAANVRALGAGAIVDQVRLVRTMFPGFNRAIVGGACDRMGGYPLGTTGTIVGPESGGKTAMITGLAKSFQEAGGLAHYIDAEFALDLAWCHTLGVSLDVYVGRRQDQPGKKPPPLFYEDAVAEVDRAIENYAEAKSRFPELGPLLIVVDSLKKLIPKRIAKKIERDKDLRKAALGREQAGLNTDWVVSLGPKIADHEIAVVFVQHEADGEDGGYRIKGGRGIRYDASVILRCEFACRVFDLAKDGDGPDNRPAAGKKHRVTVHKTKIGAQPFGDAGRFDFFVGTGAGLCPIGWDRPRELLNEAARRDLVGLPWRWNLPLTLGTRFKLGGRSRTLKQLYQKPELLVELAEMLR